MSEQAMRALSVPVKRLRRTCDPAVFKFRTTADVPALESIVGQDRAVSALNFGFEIEAPGYHVYLAGLPGTGRATVARMLVSRLAAKRPPPRDWCYVYNFGEPSRPNSISLPAGRGHSLGRAMDELITTVRREVPKAFESDEYAQRRDQINREVQQQREQFFTALAAEAKARDLAVSMTPMGINTVPTIDGKPIDKERYDQLSDEQRKAIQQRSTEFESVIAQMAPQVRRLDRAVAELLGELDRQVMRAISQPLLDEAKRSYGGEPEVVEYLERVGEDLLGHIGDFRSADEQPPTQIAPGMPVMAHADGAFNRYKVNVIVSHSPDAVSPVIEEESPSYYNMFGRSDYRQTFGSMTTDHTMIKPGALHRANGGYLIIQALEVLTQPLVWETMKRTLRTQQIRIENIGEHLSILPTASLTPEPIPLDVKVAMIGTPRILSLLQAADEDFPKLFKVKADFAIDVSRTAANIRLFSRIISHQAAVKGMRPFDRNAVARVIEHASRLASDQQKLSIRMKDVVDLLVEADFWACDAGSKRVTSAFVELAIDRKVYRSSQIEERIQEFITDDIIKVDTRGSVVGQVNGLSVYDLGDYAFGRPSRITARVSMGRGQVINLEREIQRSGASHSKGFLTLTGWLNGKFAHKQFLSFAASLTFEQVYDEVDGDSASSTELYALLSAITDIPLRQDLAVTGSVNQLGEVQAIGGVNEKVEGFYAVCKARGLTGTQGVIIPKDNVRNLMLKPEVVEAVRQGRFRVYAVSNVDQGIELLTGVPAGKVRKDGTYPEGTLFRAVTDVLTEMTRRATEANRAAQRDMPPASAVSKTEQPPEKPGKIPRRNVRTRR